MTTAILSIKLSCMYDKFRYKVFSLKETEKREIKLSMLFLEMEMNRKPVLYISHHFLVFEASGYDRRVLVKDLTICIMHSQGMKTIYHWVIY